MRVKILIALFLATAHATENEYDPIITEEPNGTIAINLYGYRIDEKHLEDLLINPDPRVCEYIDVSAVSIEKIRQVFEVYGKQAKVLWFRAASDFQYKAQEIIEVLNMLPKLEILTLHMEREFEGDFVGTLNLKNLNHVCINEFRNQTGIDFLKKVLPENILTKLEINTKSEGDYGRILNKQRSVKILKFETSNYVFNEAFNNLNLETFEIRAHNTKDEAIPSLQNFIKKVINSQPNLKFLNIIPGDEVTNDELLLEISKLSKLEHLELIVESKGLSSLEPLKNLKNLKELVLKSYNKKSIKLFDELANFKFEFLGTLTIVNEYDLPKETFERWSKNLPNLKVLEISKTFEHSIKFFAKTFPQIETLSVEFGGSNKRFEFVDAYERDDEVVHQNLKNIDFGFGSEQLVDTDDFIGFVKMFPNLERLQIAAKFRFNGEFFTKLADNLSTLEVLILGSIKIESDQSFSAETVDALERIAAKLKCASFRFDNTGDDNSFDHESFDFRQNKGVYKVVGTKSRFTLFAGDEELARKRF